MIRVVLVDDSGARADELANMLAAVSGMAVAGRAHTLETLHGALRGGTVHLIAVHAAMVHADAFALVREVMVHAPKPVVMVSERVDDTLARRAIEAGALALLHQPNLRDVGDVHGPLQAFAASLRALAGVKVVGHRLRARSTVQPPSLRIPSENVQVIAIGASTGGPSALKQVLCGLPADFPIPVLVVQHLARGFAGEFVRWLGDHVTLEVKTARTGDTLAPGSVYIAPEDRHLMVRHGRQLVTGDGPYVSGFRPAVSVLFESVARVFGPTAVAVVLSGMGSDGVTGLSCVRTAGGRVIVQDAESSVVFGMPGAAIEAGLADVVLPLQSIGPTLLEISARKKS